MAEVCGVGLKNLRTNFCVEELFSARNVSRYFLVKKNSSYIKIEPDNFIQLFWRFVGVPVWPGYFFICARNSDEYFTKFIASRFLNFPLLHFYSIASWPKVQDERNIYTNLNNNDNCFFMLCSYKNSCFSFVAIKINVRFKVNTFY